MSAAAASAPPRTPPRRRTVDATLSDGSRITARIDHEESGVPIWMTDRFVPLADAGEQDEGRQITLVPVESVPGAFVIQNFFSPAECDDIVRCSETMGFEPAKVTTTGGRMVSLPNVRSNERVIWHTDPSWMKQLNDRLIPLLQRPAVADLLPGWIPYSLNERFRVFKYTKGQEFKKHFDGGFAKNWLDRSHMTFIAYLGTPEEGGHTGFYNSNSRTEIVTVPPTKGSALVFFHEGHALSPLHSGLPVERGIKYALRSDIMFNKLQ